MSSSGSELQAGIRFQMGEFLQALAGKSPKTLNTYRNSLNRFAEFLTEMGVSLESRTQDLPQSTLERFYQWLVENYGREQRATTGTYLAGARAFFRFLARRRLLGPDASFEQIRAGLQEIMGKGHYKTPRVDRRLPLVVLCVDSVPLPQPASPRMCVRRLEILRDRAVVHTLFSTGMRREEVSRLNRQDLDDGWSAQALITGKGDKERVVFFGEDALEAIRAYLLERADRYAPLFLRHDNRRGKPGPNGQNYRLDPRAIWRIVKSSSALAGVDLSTHDFRHAKASVMLNRGASLSEVQDILGHASPETTKRIYAHYEVSHLRDAFERFSPSAEELAGELDSRARADSRAPSLRRKPKGNVDGLP